jgi:hypothetical protein
VSRGRTGDLQERIRIYNALNSHEAEEDIYSSSNSPASCPEESLAPSSLREAPLLTPYYALAELTERDERNMSGEGEREYCKVEGKVRWGRALVDGDRGGVGE